MTNDFLIVGLGNPGEKYKGSRHNVGFAVLDVFVGDTRWSTNSNKMLEYAWLTIGENKIECIKPLTFMNKSGEAVNLARTKHDIPPEKVIVVHDDIDLPVGEVRVSFGRGAGGHKGVESIIRVLGTKEFVRVRVGVAPEEGKPGKHRVKDFVLRAFGTTEKQVTEESIEKAVRAVELVVSEGVERAMNEVN